MDRGLACWVVGLLVVAAVAAPAAGATAPTGPFGVAQEEFDPDDVTLSASLHEDGSAAWSFSYRMALATDNETQAFEELHGPTSRRTARRTSTGSGPASRRRWRPRRTRPGAT